MAGYVPHNPDEFQKMLEAIGVKQVDELFADIPEAFRLKRPLSLPDGLSEAEVIDHLTDLSYQNIAGDELVCFLGAGVYDHLIPVAIKHLLQRGDFFTAYTPYQAEISQGTLQAIYEYQSLMCGLTGMDVANASMYEGATALAESAHMAMVQTGRNKLVILETIHPEYREVLKGTLKHMNAEIVEVSFEDGVTDFNKIAEKVDTQTAAVIVQYPNFFGCIEDLELICNMSKKFGAMSIVSAYPVALGLLTPPGDFGADIVCGEGQSLGIPMSFGGPYLGFIACKEALIRRIPGRLAGCTSDNRGQRGFVLTLQAREQHIRREKATSNICSDQALMALNATIYLSLLGRDGVKNVASQCLTKAHYLKKKLEKIPGVTIPFTAPFFNEFVIQTQKSEKVLKKMKKEGILPGVTLECWYPQLQDHLLIAVTEKRTAAELDLYCDVLEDVLNGH
mgnify:CR=1 FL=1